MSVYTYPESGVINEITFRKSEGGHVRAYLRAADSADPVALQEAMKTFCDKGWQCTPYSLNGKPVLEVQGMRWPTQLINLLEERKWAQGPSTYAGGKQPSLKEIVWQRSLAASGAFYVLGDSSFTMYGYKGANALNVAAGALYGAGTLSLLGGGRKDQSDLQVRDLAKKLSAYLKDHGDKLPNSCSLDSIADDHKKGLIKRADDLFRRYPSELMNLFFAAAGACIATSAYKYMGTRVSEESFQQVWARKRKEGTAFTEEMVRNKMNKYHRLEGKLDIGLGAMTGISGLFAMLVKEKKPDPDAPKKHGLEAVWQNIRQKPLAIAGVGYMVSTMCHAVSTAIAWNYADDHRRASVPWRAIFVGSNIVAELLLAISSKGHGEGVKSDKSVDHTVTALAAELIARQPVKMQEALIDHVANFLGQPDVLAIKNEEIKKQLHEQVAIMRNNPWALALPKRKAEIEENAPAATGAAKKSELPAWQAKVAAKEASAQPQLSS